MTDTIANSDPPNATAGNHSVGIDLRSMRDGHMYLLIVLLAAIIYGKSVLFQYTFSDDTQLLVVNQEFLSNLANIPKLFKTDVFISFTNPHVFYRPFLNFLFMLELQVSKDSPVIFHVTNIVLHVGCSFLLFVFLQQFGVKKLLAAATTLLFCAHPLNTSAVVWIPGRNDSLLTLLVLASFSTFLVALKTRRSLPMLGHLFFLFLALLTKETAVALPILTLSYLFLIEKGRVSLKTVFFIVTSYVLLVALWLILRSMVTRTYEVHQSILTIATSWLDNAPAFILYLGKVFFPFNLSVFPNLTDQSLILGFLSLFLLGAAYIVDRPSSGWKIAWGLAWFFLFLAPTFLSGAIFHEHRAYCSLVGLLFAVTQLPLIQNINLTKTVNLLGFVVVLALFAVLATVHSEQFRDRTAYATSAFLYSPNVDESYSAIAGLFLDEGNDAAAERVLRAGIAKNPSMMAVHRMLGDVYAKRHEYARAANEYETSIRLEPLQLYTYINYGKMCLETGRLEDAARLWKQSVTLDPEFLLGYYYLANFYIHVKNDPDSAMMYAKQIQRRGVTVVPELLRAIQENPLYKKKTP